MTLNLADGDITITIPAVMLTLVGGLTATIPLTSPVDITLTLRAGAGLSGTIAIAPSGPPT